MAPDELSMTASREVSLDARLQRREALLLQARDLGARERLNRKLPKRRPAP